VALSDISALFLQQILDADHSGVVELNDISAKYSADKHPDVIAGKRSKDDVLRYLQSVCLP
jgi:hypothetical protein